MFQIIPFEQFKSIRNTEEIKPQYVPSTYPENFWRITNTKVFSIQSNQQEYTRSKTNPIFLISNEDPHTINPEFRKKTTDLLRLRRFKPERFLFIFQIVSCIEEKYEDRKPKNNDYVSSDGVRREFLGQKLWQWWASDVGRESASAFVYHVSFPVDLFVVMPSLNLSSLKDSRIEIWLRGTWKWPLRRLGRESKRV